MGLEQRNLGFAARIGGLHVLRQRADRAVQAFHRNARELGVVRKFLQGLRANAKPLGAVRDGVNLINRALHCRQSLPRNLLQLPDDPLGDPRPDAGNSADVCRHTAADVLHGALRGVFRPRQPGAELGRGQPQQHI
ncbi:hypothetical protein G6F24_017105 [Rhizopus arrhizus]|nr:hypothetical protein G6F24_017105 [Rhizopus arrhizus]